MFYTRKEFNWSHALCPRISVMFPDTAFTREVGSYVFEVGFCSRCCTKVAACMSFQMNGCSLRWTRKLA